MKLPAVAIAAAFAGGILLGLGQCASPRYQTSAFITALAGAVFLLIVVGCWLAWKNLVWPAAIFSLVAWVALGIFSGCLANRPLPPDHVLSRLAADQIPQRTPLRWHGILCAEPERLPWGFSFEMDLTGVETAQGPIPVLGGMRIGFTPKMDDAVLSDLHAGDQIAALTEARLPLVYKDVGAFDRREFLARQGIHVLATLRATTLLERTGTIPATWQSRLARVRGRLRQQVDSMFPDSPETAGVLRAMLLGDRSFVPQRIPRLPKDWRVSCARCGRIARWGLGCVFVLGGTEAGATPNGENPFSCWLDYSPM
ncbi:MAG TPA: ComEC/Rec2 family competence protein [Candidatus Eremiobacteraceae bacterium]|nr:ComEC/Rec2 family competence protein [Candidatus Eremiobacteraceae bacterium]